MSPQRRPGGGARGGGGGLRRHRAQGRLAAPRGRHPDDAEGRRDEPLPGYKDVKPMVFAGLFPTDSDDYPELRDALEKLKLNDAALFYEPETSQALGFGFRCGFLGLLHMEIVRERLEREFDLDLLVTAPNVAYQVRQRTPKWIEVHNPAEMPRETEEVAGAVRPRAGDRPEGLRRPGDGALHGAARPVRPHGVPLRDARAPDYELPLGEIVLDFYDQLKSRTRGYASFDYDLAGFRDGTLSRVDVLVAGEQVDALSLISHRDAAYERGKLLVERLREEIPRQMFDVADPGGDRLARDRPRDRQGEAQGRAREVLRRRHLPQAQAAREAEEGQEADEAGRRRRGAAGGVPRRAQPRRREGTRSDRRLARRAPRICRAARRPGARGASRHLYVHLPFCAPPLRLLRLRDRRRPRDEHGTYVEAVLPSSSGNGGCSRRASRRIPRRRHADLHRARRARARARALPEADEVTVEANPETVTRELAALLRTRRDPRLPRRAVVPAAPARGARARCEPGGRPPRDADSP